MPDNNQDVPPAIQKSKSVSQNGDSDTNQDELDKIFDKYTYALTQTTETVKHEGSPIGVPGTEFDIIDFDKRIVKSYELKQALTNYITKQRIDEVKRFRDEWGFGTERIGDGSWEDYSEHRIAQLEKDSK